MTFQKAAWVLAVCWLVQGASTATAQQRPLQTQLPEGIGAGRVMVDVGAEVIGDVAFPASGLGGDLVRAAVTSVTVGLGAIVDVQVQASLVERLGIDERRDAPLADELVVEGAGSAGVGAVIVATKIRLLPEGARRPALGVRFATRLPTMSAEDGLGLDTTDVALTLLAARRAGPFRLAGHLGMAILASPLRGDSQNDVLLYGAAAQRAVGARMTVVAEAQGRVNVRRRVPVGTESSGQARAGIRWRAAGGVFDAAVLAGLTPRDGHIGITAGYTRVFDAFRVP